MLNPSSNLEAFDGCRNRSFSVADMFPNQGEVVCAQYPGGGIGFHMDAVVENNSTVERSYLAKRLGCAACPYSTDPQMTRVYIERSDEYGPVKETRFEPGPSTSPNAVATT